MKKIVLAALIAATCILTGCAYTDFLKNHVFTATGGAVSGSFATGRPFDKKEKNKTAQVSTGTSIAADSVVSGSGIVTADYVTPDMQVPSYWADRQITPDKLIMNRSEIESWNKKQGAFDETVSSAENNSFLIVTGKSLSVAGKTYGMGDKIPLLSDQKKEKWLQEHGREDCMDTYLVDIPLSFMGDSTNIPTTIPVSEKVQPGYVEYTRRSVLTQAFTYLGSLYLTEEEETVEKNTEFVRRVYSCFGISLPEKYKDYSTRKEGVENVSEKSQKEKIASLHSAEVGTILDFSGNLALYLGCVEQKHYAIGFFGHTCSIREITCDSPKNQPDGHTWLTDLTRIYKID